jgi:hypothetical protein
MYNLKNTDLTAIEKSSFTQQYGNFNRYSPETLYDTIDA